MMGRLLRILLAYHVRPEKPVRPFSGNENELVRETNRKEIKKEMKNEKERNLSSLTGDFTP
jgi:hypothetical protein